MGDGYSITRRDVFAPFLFIGPASILKPEEPFFILISSEVDYTEEVVVNEIKK